MKFMDYRTHGGSGSSRIDDRSRLKDHRTPNAGYAREIAQTHAVTSWDYALAEGELICYPHWRLPRMAARRREERAAAPYLGGMSYTMTPKLNLLSLYAAGCFFQNPDADPDQVSQCVLRASLRRRAYW